MSEVISIREFGRRIGFTDTYVRRMMAHGVITPRCVTTNQRNSRPEIIYELALEDWRNNYGEVKKSEIPREPKPVPVKIPKPAKVPAPKPEPKRRGRKPSPAPKQVVIPPPDEAEVLPSKPVPPRVEERASPSPAGHSKAELDRQLTRIKVQQAALDFKKKQGDLLEKSRVYATLYGFGQELRTALMTLPDRVIDDLLACTDRNVAHHKLLEAIASELERLTDFQTRELTSERK